MMTKDCVFYGEIRKTLIYFFYSFAFINIDKMKNLKSTHKKIFFERKEIRD